MKSLVVKRSVAIDGHKTMTELGYDEGKNYAVEFKYSEGQYELLPRLAEQLVVAKVDIIVALGSPSVRAAQRGKVLVHAGCEQEQVLSILRSRGLWTASRPQSHPKQRPSVQRRPDQDDTKRTQVALAIWRAITPAANTVVESLSRLARPAPPTGFDAPLPCWSEAPLGRHLADDGGAGDRRHE
jgi:hypothetical protein